MNEKILEILFLMLSFMLFAPQRTLCQEDVKIEIVDFGIYSGKMTQSSQQENPPFTGNRQEGHIGKLIEKTDKIPLKLGVIYGFRYKIISSSRNQIITLTKKRTYPETLNPQTGKKESQKVTILNTRRMGKIYFAGAVADEDWHLVPGEDKITLFYNGRKLAEKSFHLVK